MTADGTEIGKLPCAAPDLSYVATGSRGVGTERDAEANSSRNHKNLSRLDEQFSHLGLDVKSALLSTKQEFAVGVAIGAVDHGLVDHVDVESDAFTKIGVAATTQGMQTVNKINLLGIAWEGKRMPLCLLGKCLDCGVDRKEAVLNV